MSLRQTVLRTAIACCLPIAVSMGFAAAAGAAKSPSPIPEYGRCLATIPPLTGNYETTNPKCTVLGTPGASPREWYPAFGSSRPLVKPKLTTVIAPSTLAVLEGKVSKTRISCPGESGSGEYVTATATTEVLHFTNCESAGAKCESAGAPVGEIVTSLLESQLGVIKKEAAGTSAKIGARFSNPTGGPFASFSCGPVSVLVRGAVIGKVAANAMQVVAPVAFAQMMGKQKYEEFEGAAKSILEMSLNGGPYEQTGLKLKVNRTNEEPIEVDCLATGC